MSGNKEGYQACSAVETCEIEDEFNHISTNIENNTKKISENVSYLRKMVNKNASLENSTEFQQKS